MRKMRQKGNKRLHKIVFCIAVIGFAVSICSVRCSAEENVETLVNSEIEGVLGDFYDAVPDTETSVDDVNDIVESLGVKRILAVVIGVIKDSSAELTSLSLTLVGIAMLTTLSSLSENELSSAACRTIGAVGAALLFERLYFLVDGAIASLRELNEFFGAVIPLCLTVNSLGASLSTASVQATGMGLTLGLYSYISEKLLGAVACAVFVTSALSGIDTRLARISKSVRMLFLTLLGILTTLIGATFALQSTISASADSLAMRSAKYAVSSTIPIVGNAVSGALGLVSGGVTYARDIIGGGAIAVVLSVVLSPLVTLFAYRLCLRLGSAISSLCSLGGCEGVIDSFCGALDTVIAVYALTSLIYIAELVAFLKGGVSLA